MTMDDQIKDEKLQYDFNRETGTISTLLTPQIDKYEYLAGEEILLSNQKQIIDQAKFTYALLEKKISFFKSFWKTSKRKQFNLINVLAASQTKLDQLSYEGMTEIKDLSKCIDLNNWTYYFKNKHASPINLITFRGQFHLYRDVFNGNIELVKAGKDKNNLNSI